MRPTGTLRKNYSICIAILVVTQCAIKSLFRSTNYNITFLVAPLFKGKGKAKAVDEEPDEEFSRSWR